MKRTPILIVIAVAVFFVSCKNSTTGLPIPKDAAIAIHINASSLSSKLSWKKIQSTEWFKNAQQNENDSLQKKLMDDPEQSGIDIKSDFAFFLKKQGSGGYLVFEGKLKDAVAFESMVKKLHRNAEVKKDGNISYVKQEGTDLLSWTSSKFIFMSDASFERTVNTSYDDYEKNRFHQDSLLFLTKSLLNLSTSSNLESDDRFTSLMKEKGDVHFWMNMEQYMSSIFGMMGNNPVLSMMQGMNGLFEGSIATATLSFDDGKITMKSKRYLSKKMQQVMDKVQYKNITAGEVNRIPSKDVDAALIINYPPEVSKELLKALGFDGMINGFLGRYNTNLDEVVQATKGNLIVSVSDFGFNSTQNAMPGLEDSYSLPKPKVNIMLGLSINNKASFDKLISIAQQLVKDSSMLSKISFKSNKDWFAISNSSETVDGFLTGGNNQLAFADKIAGHPFGAYIDLQKIIKGAQTSFYGNFMDTSVTAIWQDVVITGGDYSKGVITGAFTVNLVDKNTNSLQQINQTIDKMYQSQKKKQEEYLRKYQNSDSTTVTMPPPMADSNALSH